MLRHVDTDQHYLRLYTGTGTAKAKTQYYRNGKPVEFAEIEGDLVAKEKRSKDGDCFCCKVEDMTDISWEPSNSNA